MSFSIKFIYGMIPVLIIWTDRFLSSWKGGMSMSLFCIIRPKYKDKDDGILEHELTHIRQFYRTLGIHNIMYIFSSKYRLRSEIEAYKNQLNVYKERDIIEHRDWIGNLEKNKKWIIKTISDNYNIKNVSYTEIYNKLST